MSPTEKKMEHEKERARLKTEIVNAGRAFVHDPLSNSLAMLLGVAVGNLDRFEVKKQEPSK